jgi:hypothetical protein
VNGRYGIDIAATGHVAALQAWVSPVHGAPWPMRMPIVLVALGIIVGNAWIASQAYRGLKGQPTNPAIGRRSWDAFQSPSPEAAYGLWLVGCSLGVVIGIGFLVFVVLG